MRRLPKILEPWFSKRRVADFEADFNKRSITWSEFRTLKQAMQDDPDLTTENPMFHKINHPGVGMVTTPAHPAQFSDFDRRPPAPAPVLGQHTEEILSDILGLNGRAIWRLFDKGVVDSPENKPHRSAA